ncbi:MAG: hypothetical protein CHACPFDD_02781 [Phycisphaerae bacterium]|nr:hypothetical protein [Phycisphaerae bacterium]
MNFKTTFILLAVLIVGGLVVYLVPESKNAPADSRSDQGDEKKKVSVFDPPPAESDLLRCTLEGQSQPRMVFERKASEADATKMDEWEFVEPIRAAAENYVISDLARRIAGAQARAAEGEAGVTPETAGLNPPAAVVTLADKSGKEYRLEIGAKAALSDDTYVRVAGQTRIQRVAQDLTRDLKKEVKEFRAKRLLKLTPEDAKHLTVTHEGKSYDFSVAESGEWVINAPIKWHGAKQEIIALLRGLNSLYADDFVDEFSADPARYGLKEPAIRLVVQTEKKKELKPPADPAASQPAEPTFELIKNSYTVEIGKFADMNETKRYVRVGDQTWAATVPAANIKTITPELRKLRDPRVTRVRAADVNELTVSLGPESACLHKSENAWQGDGDLTALDAGAVADVLAAMEDLSAIDYLDEPGDVAQYGLADPKGSVTVVASGSVEPITLLVGGNTASGRNTYVQLAGKPTVIVVDAAAAQRLAVTPLSLRSRSIVNLAGGRIVELDLTARNRHYALKLEAEQWKLAQPAGAQVDAGGVRDLVTDLSALRARRVVARDAFGSYGLESPELTIKLGVEHPAPTTQETGAPPPPSRAEHVLRVGRADGVAYCRYDDDPYIFELDQTVQQSLAGELIDRKLFDFDADKVTGVTIRTLASLVELEKRGDKWVLSSDPFVELVQKQVTDFLKELVGLRVEQYLAYSDGDVAAEGLDKTPIQVRIRLSEQREIIMNVDSEKPGVLPRKAALLEAKRIFMLRAGDPAKILKTIDDFAKPDAKKTPPGTPPAGIPPEGDEDQ